MAKDAQVELNRIVEVWERELVKRGNDDAVDRLQAFRKTVAALDEFPE